MSEPIMVLAQAHNTERALCNQLAEAVARALIELGVDEDVPCEFGARLQCLTHNLDRVDPGETQCHVGQLRQALDAYHTHRSGVPL